MNASVCSVPLPPSHPLHALFLVLLPRIQTHAEICFRQAQRLLEKPALHGLGVGRAFPGLLDTTVTPAAYFRGGRRSQIRRPSGTRARGS